MRFEDLRQAWHSSSPEEPLDASVLEGVFRRSRELERAIRWRDRVETAVAATLAPVFAAVAVWRDDPLARLSSLILIASCIAIPLRLRWARRAVRRDAADRSVVEHLRRELQIVQIQSRLLRTILWWYFLPLGVGVVLFFASGTRSWWMTAGYALVVVFFFRILWRANRAYVHDLLDPQKRRLEELLTLADESPVGPAASADRDGAHSE